MEEALGQGRVRSHRTRPERPRVSRASHHLDRPPRRRPALHKPLAQRPGPPRRPARDRSSQRAHAGRCATARPPHSPAPPPRRTAARSGGRRGCRSVRSARRRPRAAWAPVPRGPCAARGASSARRASSRGGRGGGLSSRPAPATARVGGGSTPTPRRAHAHAEARPRPRRTRTRQSPRGERPLACGVEARRPPGRPSGRGGTGPGAGRAACLAARTQPLASRPRPSWRGTTRRRGCAARRACRRVRRRSAASSRRRAARRHSGAAGCLLTPLVVKRGPIHTASPQRSSGDACR